MNNPVFQIMAPEILFCLYLLTFFLFHSEELKRDNIAEFDTVPMCMHISILGCITHVSEEYSLSYRAIHRRLFQYSGTKIISWTQFSRNTILFPVFHVIGFFYCFTLKMKTRSPSKRREHLTQRYVTSQDT